MAARPSNPKRTFSNLVQRAKQEIPPAPDLRLGIRQSLAAQRDRQPLNWCDILVSWSQLPGLRVGFGTVMATFMFVASWELSRPDPPVNPPMPTFLIDRFFAE